MKVSYLNSVCKFFRKKIFFFLFLFFLFNFHKQTLAVSIENSSMISLSYNINVAIYYRFGEFDFLSAENRDIEIFQNESVEKKLLESLLVGPLNANTQLNPLFPKDTKILNVVSQDSTLFITFNDSLLDSFDDEPIDWQNIPYWQHEVPMRRKLAMHSLAATIFENFHYRSIQILVEPTEFAFGGMRLQNSFYLDPALPNGNANILLYDDTYLLTPTNTIKTILNSWYNKDWQILYLFVSTKNLPNQSFKISPDDLINQWANSNNLVGYYLSESSPSFTNNRCYFLVDIEYNTHPEEILKSSKQVFQLFKEDDIWKIAISELELIMNLELK